MKQDVKAVREEVSGCNWRIFQLSENLQWHNVSNLKDLSSNVDHRGFFSRIAVCYDMRCSGSRLETFVYTCAVLIC